MVVKKNLSVGFCVGYLSTVDGFNLETIFSKRRNIKIFFFELRDNEKNGLGFYE